MSDYRIAHIEDIHITAAANTALSSSTKIEALTSFSVSTSTEHVELKHLNSGDGWSDHEAVWTSATASLGGTVKKDSPTQQVLIDAANNRTPFYVHAIDNPTAATGEKKGTLYCLSVESGEEPREAGQLVTFNFGCKVKGKPVDILAT